MVSVLSFVLLHTKLASIMFSIDFFTSRYIEFLMLWLLAAVQFGPNAWNCFFLAAFVDFRRAAVAVLGIVSVSITYIIIIFIGQEILFSFVNALTLTLIQWCGIVWILYIGITRLVSGQWFDLADAENKKVTPVPLSHVFRDSVIVSLSNPKVIIFYYAVFSQFLFPSTLKTQAYIYFLIALVVTSFIYTGYCILGYFAGAFIRKKIKTVPTDYISGISFIFIAFILLLDVVGAYPT